MTVPRPSQFGRMLLATMLHWTIRPPVLPMADLPTGRSRPIGRGAGVMLAPVLGRGWAANLVSPRDPAAVPTVAACPAE
jgi:hypothetical protein